ncbi:MAG: hypothetical protein R2755_15090 [Acidimicrobiales bacterium]
MFVRISAAGATPELVEPEDCKKFHVASGLVGAGNTEVASALGDWAAGATDDHVWIRVDAVQAAAAGRVPEGWAADFDAMVGYAGSKGWLNEAGDAIAAHVEPLG